MPATFDTVLPFDAVQTEAMLTSDLEAIAAKAKAFLAQFEALVLVRTQRRKYRLLPQSADRWPHALPDDASPAAVSAAELLKHCHQLRAALMQGDAAVAAWHAVQVGRLSALSHQWVAEETERRAG
jgi:hypothetical protein